jgi:hypothetical protein
MLQHTTLVEIHKLVYDFLTMSSKDGSLLNVLYFYIYVDGA